MGVSEAFPIKRVSCGTSLDEPKLVAYVEWAVVSNPHGTDISSFPIMRIVHPRLLRYLSLSFLWCQELLHFLGTMRLISIVKAKAMQTLLLTFISCATLRSVTAQYGANTGALVIKEIEHLYFDAASAAVVSAVTPCSNYYDPSTGASNNTVGRNTAAEWIRTAFRKSRRSNMGLRD